MYYHLSYYVVNIKYGQYRQNNMIQASHIFTVTSVEHKCGTCVKSTKTQCHMWIQCTHV